MRTNLIILLVAFAVAIWAEDFDEGIKPRVAAWTPSTTMLHENVTGPLSLLEGSFQIASDVAGVPLVPCSYVIPVSDGNVPAPTAADVVLRFGWIGQNALAQGESARELATKHGFTVLTVRWPQQPGISDNDRTKFSLYPESGSGAAWLRALNCVRIIGRLPERKVFAVGYSAGGSAAHQFAEGNPDVVEGVIAIAGRTFAAKPKYLGPYLILHNDHDRTKECTELEHALTAGGAPVMHYTYPPDWAGRGKNYYWDHTMDGSAWRMTCLWLMAIADQRIKHGAVLPQSRWPVVKGVRMPSKNCQEAIDAFIEPVRHVSLKPPEGLMARIASPSKRQEPRGTIWLLDRRFASGVDEQIGPAALFAKAGYRCAAIQFDDGADVGFAIGQLPKVEPVIPPLAVVMIQPSGADISLLKGPAKKISKIFVVDAFRGALDDCLEAGKGVGIKVSFLNSATASEPINFPKLSWATLSTTKKPAYTGEYYERLVQHVIGTMEQK